MPFVELFANRRAAGRALASTLIERRDPLSVVVGLTRGGLPVAFEVASSLKLPLDVLVVKKLRAPVSAELAIGAVCADGTHVLRTEVVRELGVNGAYIARELETRLAEAQEAERHYRCDLSPVDLAAASVAVVDDGLATGATMEAAVRSVRRRGARTVIVAVPVGTWAATHNIGLVADAMVWNSGASANSTWTFHESRTTRSGGCWTRIAPSGATGASVGGVAPRREGSAKEGVMRIYVGGLSYDIDDNGLRAAFGRYGTVGSAEVVIDRFSGRSRGFGFVEMPNRDEAQAAIQALNGRDLDGRRITVNEARPREYQPGVVTAGRAAGRRR